MHKPVIQANESVIRNGGFTEGFSHWKPQENDGSFGLGQDWYEGERIRYLEISDGASISQEVTVPKTLGADARYILHFLCETTHAEPGTLIVSVAGKPQECVISLPPHRRRDRDADTACLAAGRPLDYQPIVYSQEIDLPLTAQDKLKLSVLTPLNDPGDYSAVVITRIKLELCLAPLVLQTLKLDDQTLPATRPLYLCLGATGALAHRLSLVPAPGNAWQGTQAALTIENNPQGAVVAAPVWGVDQPLEDSWVIDCPWVTEQAAHLFTLNLVNQYTADPYPVTVSLGHHRLAFSEVMEAAYYPVLELQQKVRVGVQVASFYTGQTFSAVTVNWTVAGLRVRAAAVTDDSGWAYFDYEPTVAGEFDVVATVESPYYPEGVASQTLKVRVLATDPWQEVLAVVETQAAPWAEKTGYPNRGSSYPVHVKLLATSPLLGTQLWLSLTGLSPEQLGITVSPPLEQPVPVADLEPLWTLTSADRLDARFELSLGCSKLLLPSPKKTMSLARNLVKIGEQRLANKFPIIDEQESVVLRVQVVPVVNGDPVVGALVDWITPEGTLPTVATGAGGWASLLYSPATAGEQFVTARVRAHQDAQAHTSRFEVKALASSPWKSQVKILLDEVEVDRQVLGLLCWRGSSHTLKIVPLAGSALLDQPITLRWRQGVAPIGLVASDIGVAKKLTSAGLEWTLESKADIGVSTLFAMTLSTPQLSDDRELFGRLVDPDLAREVSFKLDQSAVTLGEKALYPCLGAMHGFTVVPNSLSPLVGLSMKLHWSGTSAGQLGATVTPALDHTPIIGDSGERWELSFIASPAPGEFGLALELPELKFVSPANQMLLGHNKVRIEAWREPAVDPVAGQDQALMAVQVFSHFTQRAVEQVAVQWHAAEQTVEVKTDAEGWSVFACAPGVAEPLLVDARVLSLYDEFVEKCPMTVQVLASDPWEDLRIEFDGKSAQPWSQTTCFPRRKGQHLLKVSAVANSPLLGRELTLGMTGTGPSELDMNFVPRNALGTPRPLTRDGLEYTLTVGDLKDGAFALRMGASRLAKLSPANAMSVGSGSQVIKLILGTRAAQTLDWGDVLEEQVQVVSAISGKPMAGIAVLWRSPELGDVSALTDFYGVARVSYTPQVAGATLLTATVGEAASAQSVSLPFVLNEPRAVQSLLYDGASGYPGDSVSATATVVSALTGEPLAGVEVMWEYAGEMLAPTLTGADGIATLSFELARPGRDLLMAMVKGGEGGWDVASVAVPVEVKPAHLTIKELTAKPSGSVQERVFVVLKAYFVNTEDGQPAIDKEVFVTRPLQSGGEMIAVRTNIDGIYSRLQKSRASEYLGMTVEVRNVREEPVRRTIYVDVIPD